MQRPDLHKFPLALAYPDTGDVNDVVISFIILVVAVILVIMIIIRNISMLLIPQWSWAQSWTNAVLQRLAFPIVCIPV